MKNFVGIVIGFFETAKPIITLIKQLSTPLRGLIEKIEGWYSQGEEKADDYLDSQYDNLVKLRDLGDRVSAVGTRITTLADYLINISQYQTPDKVTMDELAQAEEILRGLIAEATGASEEAEKIEIG